MSIVLDANLLVALVSGDHCGNQVSQVLLSWIDRGIDLHAPELTRYEVANALTRLIIGNAFPADRVEQAWNDLSILPITYHNLTEPLRIAFICTTRVFEYPTPTAPQTLHHGQARRQRGPGKKLL